MTDMHREAFEKWVESTDMHTAHGKPYFTSAECQFAWRAWQAAMRYRDEQEKQA